MILPSGISVFVEVILDPLDQHVNHYFKRISLIFPRMRQRIVSAVSPPASPIRKPRQLAKASIAASCVLLGVHSLEAFISQTYHRSTDTGLGPLHAVRCVGDIHTMQLVKNILSGFVLSARTVTYMLQHHLIQAVIVVQPKHLIPLSVVLVAVVRFSVHVCDSCSTRKTLCLLCCVHSTTYSFDGQLIVSIASLLFDSFFQ